MEMKIYSAYSAHKVADEVRFNEMLNFLPRVADKVAHNVEKGKYKCKRHFPRNWNIDQWYFMGRFFEALGYDVVISLRSHTITLKW